MLNNGCFKHCSNCKLLNNCCTHFDKINAPTLNKKELAQIKKQVNIIDFYNEIDNNLYNLKISDNKCIFFINNKCSIYDIRPTDCRLYPFDIISLNNKYYFILYKLDCIQQREFKNIQNSIDPLIDDIKPWIKEFTDKRNYDKMQNIKYTIIKEICLD